MKENCDSELRGRFQNNDYVIVSLFFCQMLTCQVNISKNRWEPYFFFFGKTIYLEWFTAAQLYASFYYLVICVS